MEEVSVMHSEEMTPAVSECVPPAAGVPDGWERCPYREEGAGDGELQSASGASMFELASRLMENGRPRVARRMLRRGVRAGEPCSVVWEAWHLFNEGDLDGAIALARVVAAGSSPAAELARDHLTAWLWRRRGEGSEAQFRDLVRRMPGYTQELAEFLESTGRADEAIGVLRSAMDAGVVDAALPLGNRLAKRGDRRGAMDAYSRGVAMGDAFSAYNGGLELIEAGKLEEGRRWIRRAADGGDRTAVRWLRSDRRESSRRRRER